MDTTTPRSRASSLSRQSSRRSRSQSLIKKHVLAQSSDQLKPSDILIERFVAWKAIVRQLISYFEGVSSIHLNTARELTKLGAVIQVPFRAGNQFLGEGGLQDVFYGVRDKTRVVADQHANLGRTIESSIVQHLVKLRSEIKAHIKNIQNDTGRLATSVAKERELSTKLISELTSSVSTFKNTPMSVTNKTDPYVTNTLVIHQLQKQVHEVRLGKGGVVLGTKMRMRCMRKLRKRGEEESMSRLRIRGIGRMGIRSRRDGLLPLPTTTRKMGVEGCRGDRARDSRRRRLRGERRMFIRTMEMKMTIKTTRMRTTTMGERRRTVCLLEEERVIAIAGFRRSFELRIIGESRRNRRRERRTKRMGLNSW